MPDRGVIVLFIEGNIEDMVQVQYDAIIKSTLNEDYSSFIV